METTASKSGADGTSNDQEKEKSSSEPVQSCAVEVRLDPATGVVTALQTKGPTVSETRSVYWGRAQLIFVLVLPFLLIALYYLSGYLSEWYTHKQHTDWLIDFYQKNAPEVGST